MFVIAKYAFPPQYRIMCDVIEQAVPYLLIAFHGSLCLLAQLYSSLAVTRALSQGFKAHMSQICPHLHQQLCQRESIYVERQQLWHLQHVCVQSP